MTHIFLPGFKIKIAKPKKDTISSNRKHGVIAIGTVIEESDGVFKVEIDKDKNGVNPPKILDFTPESFDLVDKISVFTRAKDENGRRTRIIRKQGYARVFPGITKQYIPFDKDWIVKGYILKVGLTEVFDFKRLIGKRNYTLPEDNYEEI